MLYSIVKQTHLHSSHLKPLFMQERECLAYAAAAKHLAAIGRHPGLVDQATIGYFMEADNVFGYIEKDPTLWYGQSDAHFEDLAEADRSTVLELIEKVFSSPTPAALRNACAQCAAVATAFFQMTALPPEEELTAYAD